MLVIIHLLIKVDIMLTQEVIEKISEKSGFSPVKCREIVLLYLEEVKDFIHNGDGDKDVLFSPSVNIRRRVFEDGVKGIVVIPKPKSDVSTEG